MDRLLDLLRASLATGAISLTVVAAGQLAVEQPPPAVSVPTVTVGLDPQQQITLAQWAIQQGGFLVVILVILFFYRRDWKAATEFWKSEHKQTTDLAAKCATAVADNAAAVRESTVVMHQAKTIMARYLPDRRDA